jgi:hypothetical protein
VALSWTWAIVFLPIETALSFGHASFPLSGYAVNVLGVGITLGGAVSSRRGRHYADGLLAAGWGWTTAVFWRATNLRYDFAAAGGPLYFGSIELWLAPVFTAVAAALFVATLVLLCARKEDA